MESTAIATLVKMMERLPEGAQAQVVDHLREYIAELEDEDQWDVQFAQSEAQLIAAARKARQQIEEGKSQPMDYDRL
jgi:erythromycin esterase-like protein